MLYYKLKISLNDYEDKLNRTILFKKNNDLDSLAFTILSIFNTLAYHLYLFEDDVNTYECELSLKEAELSNDHKVGIDTYLVTINNLKMKENKFKMIYDFGANYEFVIEVLDEVELSEIYHIPYVLDGVGYGIVEDDKESFINFLERKDLEDPVYFIKNGRFANVDFNSCDIDEINNILKRRYGKIRRSYLFYNEK